MPANDIRYIIHEEYIPVDHVSDMLKVADKLFELLPEQRAPLAENLRRSMVWMIKYIAPTSQFWDWQTIDEPYDNQTRLRVKFIGLGWLVALTRTFSSADHVSPVAAERELSTILTEITGHIPVHAVARLKSTAWSRRDVVNLSKALQASNEDVCVSKRTGTVSLSGIRIFIDHQERVRHDYLSVPFDGRTHRLLGDIKRWANADRKYEGADWCAYKRRRLTVLVRRVPISRAAPLGEDFTFTNEPTGLYVRNRPSDYDCIVEAGPNGSTSTMGTIVFPLYPYHTGVVNPRAVIRATRGLSEASLSELLHYVSYLWVNHYTRLWCYLDFEDQFAYANDIWHLKELDEQTLVGYTGRALHLEELRSTIEMLNRIDRREINAYRPPHSTFSFTAARTGSLSVIATLRVALIPSTITQLQIDPLIEAPNIMRHANAELNQAYGTFSQAASLRMQRLLQILQVVFLLAALAAILGLIPAGAILNTALVSWISHDSFYQSLYRSKESVSWLRPFHLSLYFVQAVTLSVLFIASVGVVRSKAVSRVLKRWLQ